MTENPLEAADREWSMPEHDDPKRPAVPPLPFQWSDEIRPNFDVGDF
jgi:hypothetical protein